MISFSGRHRALGALLALALGACALLMLAGLGNAAPRRARRSAAPWVAAWAASPLGGDTARFNNQTVRNIIYTSVSGSEVQVRLSNTFGNGPVEVGATSLGVVLDGAQLVPRTSHSVTFAGHTSVTIPAGEQV